jgi:hypothetical protein
VDAEGFLPLFEYGGKLILSNDQSSLSAQCPSLDSTVDLVLWGQINCEGYPAAPASDGHVSIVRANGGCTDTNNDAADFSLGEPSPRNTGTTHSCTAGPDCNGNGVDDTIELQNAANDCNGNGQLDACEIVSNPSLDCDQNGVMDCTDLKTGANTDVNANGTPDRCEGAVAVLPVAAVHVLNSGVSTDTAMWRVQGSDVQDVNGRPAPAYGAARWSNASIVAALNAAHPNGWSISSIHLNMIRAVDPVNAPGQLTLRYTNADGVNLTPGNTATKFTTFAANYPDALVAVGWSYSTGGAADAHTIYSSPGPNTAGGEAVAGEVLSGAGTLTLVLSPVNSGVAAPYAGISHASLVEPQLVIFAEPVVSCGNSDFNGDGDFGTDQDIEAFFACLAGNCCGTCWEGGSDFNGDGDFGTDQDIEAFFRVLAGGAC